MDRERWKQIGRLFQAAVELPPEDREGFLRRECAGDPELEGEVLSLLASDEGVGSFMERPTAGGPAEALRDLASGALVTSNGLAGRSQAGLIGFPKIKVLNSLSFHVVPRMPGTSTC